MCSSSTWRVGVLAVLAAVLLVRCDFSGSAQDASRLVVEAFFVSEEPLPPIQLRQTRGLNDPVLPGDPDADAARGATVRLSLNGDTVRYVESDEPGRYEPLQPRRVPSGASYRLLVEWEGERASAGGIVPAPINIETTCLSIPSTPVEAILVDSLRRDSLDIPAEQGFIFPIDVTLRWPGRQEVADAPASVPSWVRAELDPSATFSSSVVDFFLQPVEVDREVDFPATSTGREWTGVYAISVDAVDDPLPEHAVTVALARGDSAFASFSTSRTDPERREPVSNVDGAVGIATALALDTLRFDLDDGTEGRICQNGRRRAAP